MTTKEKKDVFQIVTEKIMQQLEKGVIPWRKPWKGGSAYMPKNFVTKKSYRGINPWLLAGTSFEKGYESPFWVTFKQAQALGGKVKKGEKGTLIVFWKWLFKKVNGGTTDKIEGIEALETTQGGAPKKIPLLRYYYVFNVEQCEGFEIPQVEKPQGKEFKPIEQAEALVEGYKTKPEIKHAKQQAYYSPRLDYINMPKKESFDHVEEYYSTLFHELVHSTGHDSRLKREGFDEAHFFGDVVYSKEELVAEFGASFLCGFAGIENQTVKNSSAYIKGWVTMLKGDKRLLVMACAKAQKAVDYVLGTEPVKVESEKEKEAVGV